MFTNDCKLIGVASRMSEGQSKASLHTNLTIDVNRAFYQQLTSNTKAYLCGMTGMDSGHCSADGVTQYNAALPATEMPCDTKPAVSNPTTMTSEIFVAAEDGSTANSVRLKASVTANVSKVSLCETPTTNKNEMSTLAKCNTTSLSLASEKISDTSRVVYATGANFSPTAKLYTMVAFDSTNNVVGFRHISVEQK